MNSCDNLIERSRNTYLFKSNLKKIMLFFNRVTEFALTSCYLSADRDDGKIYLNVEFSSDEMELEKYVKDWIQFNHEIIETFHIEYAADEKRFIIRLK